MQHAHFKEIGQFPNGIDNNDANKNIDGYSAFNQFVDIVKQNSYKKDIDKINNPKIPKFELIQDKSVFVNLTK